MFVFSAPKPYKMPIFALSLYSLNARRMNTLLPLILNAKRVKTNSRIALNVLKQNVSHVLKAMLSKVDIAKCVAMEPTLTKEHVNSVLTSLLNVKLVIILCVSSAMMDIFFRDQLALNAMPSFLCVYLVILLNV